MPYPNFFRPTVLAFKVEAIESPPPKAQCVYVQVLYASARKPDRHGLLSSVYDGLT